MATNTPVLEPSSVASPARSNASAATSSSSRCWGSIASASAVEIPKRAASKSNTRSRNPPCRDTMRPGVPGLGSW
jgi:hypothetical protein